MGSQLDGFAICLALCLPKGIQKTEVAAAMWAEELLPIPSTCTMYAVHDRHLSLSAFFLELSLIADVINKVAPLLRTAPPKTSAEKSA